MKIGKVGVIGSGIMGSGIAAHLANAGIPSLLLDLASPHEQQRDALARAGIERALKARPAAFFTSRDARLITPGTIEDDLPRLAEVDWVVEAVVERLDVKRDLFARLAEITGPETIISSNTSGLPAASMVEGLPESFRRRFLVTHFFNPVRYMKLLELVPGPGTDPAVVEEMARFGRAVLGKGVVVGKDTPNFIGNRIGVYGFMAAMHRMTGEGYSIDEVDTILGPALGRPKSAVFRTADLAGLDTLLHVSQNLYEAAPHDECREVFAVPDYVRSMVERGWLGEKSGQGFYKRVKHEGGSQILTLDLETMEYRPQERLHFTSLDSVKDIADPAERLRRVLAGDDRAARFAWEMVADLLTYAANRVPEIADRVEAVDQAMRWGFNWDLGPFETWDALGVRAVADRLAREGRRVPELAERVLAESGSFYGGAGLHRTVFVPASGAREPLPRPEGTFSLAELKETFTIFGGPENHKTKIFHLEAQRGRSLSMLRHLGEGHRDFTEGEERRGGGAPGAIIKGNRSASLLDLGDGIACLEFHSKLNTIDVETIALLAESIRSIEGRFRGLVIGNDAADFSAGANLVMLLMGARMRQWKQIEQQVKALQDAHMLLKYSPIPVVVAAAGRTLAGGAEIMLHGARVRAHAELYCGLVEMGVGLVPAGGGCKEMLLRYGAAVPAPSPRSQSPLVAAGAASADAGAGPLTSLSASSPRLRALRPDWRSIDQIYLAAVNTAPPAPQSQALPQIPARSQIGFPPGGPFPPVRGAFEVIALAKVSTSAEEARELRFLRPNDPVSLDRDRLLADAKADAIAMAEAGYAPPQPPMLLLPGEGGRLALEDQIAGFLRLGTISEHDAVVAGKLATVLTGGDASPITPVSEQHVLDLEREAFLSLCGMAKTQERMNALLQTGKPLRN